MVTQDRTDWRLIALLYVTGLLASAQFAKIALTLADLADAYPDSSPALLVSAVSFAGALFGATAGVVVGKFGPRKVLLAAMTATGLLSLLQATLPPYPVMFLLRIIEGGAHLGIVVAAPTLMAAVAQGPDKPLAMGLWGTFFGVGFAICAAVIPVLGTPPLVLFAHGVAILVVAFLLRPLLPGGLGEVGEGRVSFLSRHVAIYGTPRIVAPSLGFFAHTLIFMGLLTFLPRLLGDWIGPVLPLVSLLGTFGAGVLARYARPRDIALIGFLGSIIGFSAALFAGDAARVSLMLLSMIAVGLVPGAAFASIPQLNFGAADQAAANGAIAQLGNVGTALSVPLFALALEVGFTGVAVVTIALSAVGMSIVWLIHKKIASTA